MAESIKENETKQYKQLGKCGTRKKKNDPLNYWNYL